jgi:hypothetical protein
LLTGWSEFSGPVQHSYRCEISAAPVFEDQAHSRIYQLGVLAQLGSIADLAVRRDADDEN